MNEKSIRTKMDSEYGPEEDLSQAALERRAPSRVIKLFSYCVLWPLFGLATVAFGSVSLLASIFDDTGRIQHNIARAWGSTLLRLTLSPVRVIGAENLRKAPVAVYTANHLSYMDTPVVLSKLPFQFRILARHALFKLPFIGWYLRRSGQIDVDSTSLRSTLGSLNRGVKALRAGTSLVIFPEGGRAADGRLQDFQSGPAYMAIRAQVPIVPLALIGTYELMPMHTYHLRPRPLLLIAGEPISTAGYTNKMADALTQRLHEAISEMYASQIPSKGEFDIPAVEGNPTRSPFKPSVLPGRGGDKK